MPKGTQAFRRLQNLLRRENLGAVRSNASITGHYTPGVYPPTRHLSTTQGPGIRKIFPDQPNFDRPLPYILSVPVDSREQFEAGDVRLSHIDPHLLPYLVLGQWIHVGKSARFGMGRYCLLPEA